jgi:hypothetical protein
MLNWAPHRGSSSTHHKVGTRWKWMVPFHALAPLSLYKGHLYPLNMRLCGFIRADLEALAKRKSFTCTDIWTMVVQPVESHYTDRSILYCWQSGSRCYTLRYKQILFLVFELCSVWNYLCCNRTMTKLCVAVEWWGLWSNVTFCSDKVQYLNNRDWTELNDSWRNISRWHISLYCKCYFICNNLFRDIQGFTWHDSTVPG